MELLGADELLERIRAEGGRVFRCREVAVFCLTTKAETAAWLIDIGGKPYRPQLGERDWSIPQGNYRRTRDGELEWDIYLHMIPLRDDERLWEHVH